ncbi:MAG: NotI family restriction endonuclease [Bacillota bacterium]
MSSHRSQKEVRFGIGEWYGRSLPLLTGAERKALEKQRTDRGKPVCPFRGADDEPRACSKSGGVCTLRLYQVDDSSGRTVPVQGPVGMLRTTCPNRFLERGVIFEWVGQVLLGCPNPILLREVPYLKPVETEGESMFGGDAGVRGRAVYADDAIAGSGVGSVDYVLVHPDSPTSWCALEMQAVYFSGDTMAKEFHAIASAPGDDLPFPAGRRRPDYRSSGPKRLMPQLQIKVPSLRRWGRKTAVVVDQWFWGSLGRMRRVKDISNCDIVWFVVGYDEADGVPRLTRYGVVPTTLEDAIEGLTAGEPVSLAAFEGFIRAKIGSG